MRELKPWQKEVIRRVEGRDVEPEIPYEDTSMGLLKPNKEYGETWDHVYARRSTISKKEAAAHRWREIFRDYIELKNTAGLNRRETEQILKLDHRKFVYARRRFRAIWEEVEREYWESRYSQAASRVLSQRLRQLERLADLGDDATDAVASAIQGRDKRTALLAAKHVHEMLGLKEQVTQSNKSSRLTEEDKKLITDTLKIVAQSVDLTKALPNEIVVENEGFEGYPDHTAEEEIDDD